MNKLYVLSLALTLCSAQVFSQTEPKRNPRTKLEIDGAIAMSTDGKAVYFNMGGPGINFTVSKLQFSINMLPSIGISKKTTAATSAYSGATTVLNATPVLGTGFQVFYKKFIFCVPFYYKFTNNTWVGTVGVGYKILKF